MKRTILTVIVTAIITAAVTTSYIRCKSNYLNMDSLISFDATETGLILYMEDGNGYYWERGNNNE